jgi:hypothetical protein
MAIVAVISIYLILGLLALRAYNRVRPYRLETPERIAKYRGGAWVWLFAVISPRNYQPRGKSALRWFWFWICIYQLGLVAILVILVSYYP